MYSKREFKLKQAVVGRWGQFMDSKKAGIRLGLGLALLVFPKFSPLVLIR